MILLLGQQVQAPLAQVAATFRVSEGKVREGVSSIQNLLLQLAQAVPWLKHQRGKTIHYHWRTIRAMDMMTRTVKRYWACVSR